MGSFMWKRIVLAALGLAVVALVGVFIDSNLMAPDQCDVCYRPLHAETYYRIHMADGKALDVCCPRCGLRFQAGRDDVVRTKVTDFGSNALLDAEDAFYVEGSPVHFCGHAHIEEDRSGTQYELAYDRCLPSLIAFESREGAVRFIRRNGGVLKTMDELLKEPAF